MINVYVIILCSVIDALIEVSKDHNEHFRGSLTAQVMSRLAPQMKQHMSEPLGVRILQLVRGG